MHVRSRTVARILAYAVEGGSGMRGGMGRARILACAEACTEARVLARAEARAEVCILARAKACVLARTVTRILACVMALVLTFAVACVLVPCLCSARTVACTCMNGGTHGT